MFCTRTRELGFGEDCLTVKNYWELLTGDDGIPCKEYQCLGNSYKALILKFCVAS